MAEKTTAAKPKTVKKSAESGDVESRLSALEMRVADLEAHDIKAGACKTCHSMVEKVKAYYAENPTNTILIGVGILIVLILIF